MRIYTQVLCQSADKKAVIIPIQPNQIAQNKNANASQGEQGQSINQASGKNLAVSKTDPTLTPLGRLQTGQILRAVVLEQLSTTSVLLSIGKSRVSAETSQPLNTGTQLQLKVVSAGNQPVLQAQVLADLNAQTSKAIQQLSNDAVRQTLPKQVPIAEFISNIKLIRPAEQQQHSSAPLVQQTLQALQAVQTGVDIRSNILTSEGMKKLIQHSGIFLESNLASNKTNNPARTDFKGKLLLLLGLLGRDTASANNSQRQTQNLSQQVAQNTPATTNASILSLFSSQEEIAQLRRHVESAVARIQLNQINSLPVNEQEPQAWLLELPIKDGETTDVLSLKISEDEANNEEQENSKNWSVVLSFDLKGLGAMHARLSLGGEKISASLWAEDEQTFKLLESNIDRLSLRLADVAFIDPQVQCYQGKPETDATHTSFCHDLVNIKI